MKYLGEAIKHLPNNLKYFELNLSKICLGVNIDNMKFLGNGMN